MVSLDTRTSVLATVFRILCQKNEQFSLKVRKLNKHKVYEKQCSLPKGSYGYEDTILVKKFFQKSLNFSLNIRKGKKNITFMKKIVFCKMIHTETKNSILTPVPMNFCPNTEKF